MEAAFQAAQGSSYCGMASHSIIPGASSWRFIGPQNVTSIIPDPDIPGINTLDEHLGQINKIIVNPGNYVAVL